MQCFAPQSIITTCYVLTRDVMQWADCCGTVIELVPHAQVRRGHRIGIPFHCCRSRVPAGTWQAKTGHAGGPAPALHIRHLTPPKYGYHMVLSYGFHM
jgi:hypothetical protein